MQRESGTRGSLWRYMGAAVLPLVLLATVIGFALAARQNEIALAERKLDGLGLIAEFFRVSTWVREARGLSFLGIDSRSAPYTRPVDEALLAAASGKAARTFGLSRRIAALESRFTDLLPLDAGDFPALTAMLQEIRVMSLLVAQRSGLTSDRDLPTNYQVQLLVQHIPALNESLGRLRGLAGGYGADVGEATRDNLLETVGAVEYASEQLAQIVDALGGRVPELNASVGELQHRLGLFLGRARHSLEEGPGGIDPLRFFEAGSSVLTQSIQVNRQIERQIEATLRLRAKRLHTEQNLSAALAAIGLALLLWFIGSFYLTNRRDFRTIALRESEIQQLNNRLAMRMAEISAVNQELETFSYTVSHDLRAPLRHVSMLATAMEEEYAETLDAHARDYLSKMKGAVMRMDAQIAGILELSRVGRAELNLREIDLSRMALEVLEELHSVTGEQRRATVAEGLSACADPVLIRVVLENLLGNAWKYTGATEQPVIEFGGEPASRGGFRFYVRDNGTGFDMQHAERLFQPFQRLSSDPRFPGTGIGLATVKRILQRLGGRIWAEAEPGRGACFHFTLPTACPSRDDRKEPPN